MQALLQLGPSPGAIEEPSLAKVLNIVRMSGAGADIVLGMVPFARELLRMGAEVVMVANSLPAINDITTPELRALLQDISEVDPIIKVSLWLALALLLDHSG